MHTLTIGIIFRCARTSLISFFIAVIAVTAGGVLSPQYLGLALSYSFQLNETSKTLVYILPPIVLQ